MKRLRRAVGIAAFLFCAASNLFTAYAGWEHSGGGYRYRNEDGSYVAG